MQRMPKNNLKANPVLKVTLEEAHANLEPLSPQKRLEWAYNQFGSNLAITTSFGIQSAVLLHMVHLIDNGNTIKVIWVDTGYLPSETYQYADMLSKQLKLNITIVQSEMSPARMEALYGKLWENKTIKDLETYHKIRKIQPLENALEEHDIHCWASGVRSNQTDNRGSMKIIESIRNRFSLRPILEWSQKDIFYYMQKNGLPTHPLFDKGYSTVGDWHSSSPDSNETVGRKTRFGGLKQECGIHLPDSNKEE